MQLAECIRDGVCKVHDIILSLERIVEWKLIVFLSSWPKHRRLTIITIAIIIIVSRSWLTQFWQLVCYIWTLFNPTIICEVFYAKSFFFVFDVEHWFYIDPHSVQIETLSLCEVDKVKLDIAYSLLIFYFEVKPLVMAACIWIDAHKHVELIAINLNNHVQISWLETGIEN